MRSVLLLIVAGVLVVLGALAGGPILERHRRTGEMRALRTALDQARHSADSCKIALVREEAAFLRFDRGVDSLRNVVDSFEDSDQGGVPQAEYRDYLEKFDQYNDLVEDWQLHADSLQAREARCRALVAAHNSLADSINTLREEWRALREEPQ
jgi:hypothetical protein